MKQLYVLNMKTLEVMAEYQGLREVREHHPELLFGISGHLAGKMREDKAFAANYLKTQLANLGGANILPEDADGQEPSAPETREGQNEEKKPDDPASPPGGETGNEPGQQPPPDETPAEAF